MKILLLPLLALLSCGKDSSYVYHSKTVSELTFSETHSVIGESGAVDIVWVIDNSGSMAVIQNEVIANTEKFMREFRLNRSLDWKMGLLSTAQSEAPYIGFRDVLDRTSADPIALFQGAVGRLGTSGDSTERSFTPVMNKLREFPGFLRPNAHLVTIFVTDEYEQSNVTARSFLDDMYRHKNGRKQLVKVYAALHAKDFGCQTSYGNQVEYANSVFEAAITETKGKVYSTCTNDFGVELANLGNEIVAAISSPVILLSRRPVASTISVNYKGAFLPGGPKTEGGFWVYDPDANGVRFHDMDFVDFNERFVKIDFDIDLGQDTTKL
ncbi:MAG: hypothetical protein LW878_11745 [Proteobacteria bacterium]|nr:hypothetical protein [Pseudomonadota bacterium]